MSHNYLLSLLKDGLSLQSGIKDCVTKETLKAGDRIVVCKHCKLSGIYLENNWSGTCVYCGGTEVMEFPNGMDAVFHSNRITSTEYNDLKKETKSIVSDNRNNDFKSSVVSPSQKSNPYRDVAYSHGRRRNMGCSIIIFLIVLLIIIIALLLAVKSCSSVDDSNNIDTSDVKQNSSILLPSTDPVSNQYNNTTRQTTILQTTTSRHSTTTSVVTSTTPSYTVIDTNSFSGKIVKEKQVDEYKYTPKISGVYRFDLESSDVQSNYLCSVYAPDGSELASFYYSSGGKNVELNADSTYTIFIRQYSGTATYTIQIGIPSNTRAIDGTTFSGSITYKGQEDNYTYIAPKTGRYRFDFDTDNVQSNYTFSIVAANNSELAYTYYSNGGTTVDLAAGESYSIKVMQRSGNANYTINIGIPNEINKIDGTSFSGKITYKDQEDNYTYIAPKTGRYRFDFGTDNVQSNYTFSIAAADNSELAYTYYTNGGTTVDLNAGESYSIKVKQRTNTSNYTIKIGVPNDKRAINGLSFSGDLTYKDQEDIYTFIAPSTGMYRFDFNSSNVQSNYIFRMYASNNGELAYTYYSNGHTNVELTSGEQYTIIVQQRSDMSKYEITITAP